MMTTKTKQDFSLIYFMMLVVIGAFFLINVALAVVWESFLEKQESRTRW